MELPADLEGMLLFIKVIEHGGLSAAGRALGIPKATISRRLSRLEDRLGVQLLRRSTRSLTLTDAGEAYHRRCLPIVADAEAAELEARARNAGLSGQVRVTATTGFGQSVVLPRVLAFMQDHPAVRIELDLADRRVNVIRDGFDLAIRMGELEDAELLSRRLTTVERRLVASPAYLAAAGHPTTPDALRGHRCLVSSPETRHWTLLTDEQEAVVSVAWRLAIHGVFALRDAVLAGHGIAILPAFVADQAIVEGRLTRVLPRSQLRPLEATALYPRTRVQSLAARSLLDFLADCRSASTGESP